MKTMIVIAAAVMVISCIGAAPSVDNDVSGAAPPAPARPDPFIPVPDLATLLSIGDTVPSLSASYVQTADIDFSVIETDPAYAGYKTDLGKKVVVNAMRDEFNNIVFTILYGNIEAPSVIDGCSFGDYFSANITSNVIIISNSDSGYDGTEPMMFVTRGTLSSTEGDFIISLEVPADIPDIGVRKESYHRGNFFTIFGFTGKYYVDTDPLTEEPYRIIGMETTGNGSGTGMFSLTEGVELSYINLHGGSHTTTTFETESYTGSIVSTDIGNSVIYGCSSSASVAVLDNGSYVYVGGIIGLSTSTTVAECTNSGNVYCSSFEGVRGAYVGGIVGRSINNSFIYGSVNNGIVSCTGNSSLFVGGIVGSIGLGSSHSSVISGCVNRGYVTVRGYNYIETGGIVGHIGVFSGHVGDVTVTECVNDGPVYASNTTSMSIVGGIAGYISSDSGVVLLTMCTNNGDMTIESTDNYTYTGGILGNSTMSGTILTDLINTGDMTATALGLLNAGGIIGRITNPDLQRCENSGNLDMTSVMDTGVVSIGGIVGYMIQPNSVTPLTSSELTNSGDITLGASGGTSAYVGGIGGWMPGNMEIFSAYDLVNHGNLTVTSTAVTTYVGGITGFYGMATVSLSSNSGNLVVDALVCHVGGISGSGSSLDISDSANTGDLSVTSTERMNIGGISGNSYTLNIANVFNAGSIVAESNSMGGIVGYATLSVLIDTYYLASEGLPIAGNPAGVTLYGMPNDYMGNTSDELKTKSTYNTVPAGPSGSEKSWRWAPAGPWGMIPGDYPSLTGLPWIDITVQPSDTEAYEGNLVIFTVGVATPSVSYQWYKDGSPVAGATEKTFKIVAGPDDCEIYCLLSAVGYEDAETYHATLTILPSIIITQQPVDRSVVTGNMVEFTITAIPDSVTYQWYNKAPDEMDWVIMDGATSAVLALNASLSMDGTMYRCTLSLPGITPLQSDGATLEVLEKPNIVITEEPSDITVYEGRSATFTVKTAVQSVSYQWYRDGSPVTGATDETFTFTAGPDDVEVHCLLSCEGYNDTETYHATLTIDQDILITEQPVDSTVAEGETAEFSISALPIGVTYQWYSTSDDVTWTPVTGGTSPTLNVENTTYSMDGMKYMCKVSNTTDHLDSDAAVLNVIGSIMITQQPVGQSVVDGSTAQFTVAAIPNNVTYQWYSLMPGETVWVIIDDGTSAVLVLDVTYNMRGTQYRCTLSFPGMASVDSDAATLTVTEKPKITIETEPSDTTGILGGKASFTVIAGPCGVTYQWQRLVNNTWVDIPWETSATVTVKDITIDLDGEKCRCMLKLTGAVTIYTREAVLTVTDEITITLQPSDTSSAVGGHARFDVSAEPYGVMYQWYAQMPNGTTWVPMLDETSATLIILNVKAADDGMKYRCMISLGGMNSIDSDIAVLSVTDIVTITKQPTDAVSSAGADAMFEVTGSPTGVMYQWYSLAPGGTVWEVMPGEDEGILVITGVAVTDDGTGYHCVVYLSTSNSATSDAAILTVTDTVTIISHPEDTSVMEGGTAVYEVEGAPTGVTYQWYHQTPQGTAWEIMPGENSGKLSIYNATTSMNGTLYRCRVSLSSTNYIDSYAASLTVTDSIVITGHPADISVDRGGNAAFTVTATPDNLSYQWYKMLPGTTVWVKIVSGGTSASLSVNDVTEEMDGTSYRCEVSYAGLQPVNSGAAKLTVTIPSEGSDNTLLYVMIAIAAVATVAVLAYVFLIHLRK